MKNNILGILCLSASLFASCSKDDNNNTTPTKARVKFVHSAVIGDSLQARSNGTAITSVPKLKYMGSSGYVQVDPGTASYGFYSTVTGLLYKDTSVNLSANNSYTVYAAGSVSSSGIMVTMDDLTAPASGNAKIRFVNLTPENINLTASVDGINLDSNIAYKTATAFREVTAGAHTVSMSGSNVLTVINLTGQQLASGKIYTYIYTGVSGGAGTTAYMLMQTTNN